MFQILINREEKENFFFKILKIEKRKRMKIQFFRARGSERGQYFSRFLEIRDSCWCLRRSEPSKDLVSQSLSSKLTCEREMAQKALELLLTAQNAFEREREISSQGSWPLAHSSQRVRERERSAHKALELLLTAQSAFEREISSQGCHKLLLHLGEFLQAFHVITKERLDGLRF